MAGNSKTVHFGDGVADKVKDKRTLQNGCEEFIIPVGKIQFLPHKICRRH